MSFIKEYSIFVLIGLFTGVGPYHFFEWQWWAIAMALNTGVWMHVDYWMGKARGQK
jgi:hypothetical protein